MKKIQLVLFFCICSFFGKAQVYADSITHAIEMANALSYEEACDYLIGLEPRIPTADTNRIIAVEIIVELATAIEKYYRMNEEYAEAVPYAEMITELINKEKASLPDNFSDKIPFAIKNQLVSNFALGNSDEAGALRKLLYSMQANGELPDGLDTYYNYDFFTVDSLNVWGYEWFAPLPKNRNGSSFSKVVYYVYSTDEQGNDKDQLYRLHVLMYHGNSDRFDYVLTKRVKTAKNEPAGTLYCYNYKERLDYARLRKDVVQVINGNLQPCLEAEGN